MSRRIDYKFGAWLLAGTLLAGGSVVAAHHLQSGRIAGALLRRGEQAELRGDLVEAETYLGRYIALRPDDDEALASYALVLDRHATSARDRAVALRTLERALGRAPGRVDIRRRVIALEMSAEIRRFREARDHLQVLQQDAPNDGELEGLTGRCLEALAAGEDADRRLGADPKAIYEDAARHYERSSKLAPARIESYVRLAGLLGGPLADRERADKVMDARVAGPGGSGVVGKNPALAAAYLARARYRHDRQIDGDTADVARALELAPDDADALLAAATVANATGDPAAARGHLERAIKFHPTDRRPTLELSALEARTGRNAAAADVLRDGLRRLPGDTVLQWGLADASIQAGRFDEATALIEDLRRQRNIVEPVLDCLAARVLLGKGELAAGTKALASARAQLPESPGSRDLVLQVDLVLASAYEQLGNPDAQIAACNRALALDPKSTLARSALAGGLLTLGRVDEAIEAYREAARAPGPARVALARLLIARNLRIPEARRNWDEVDALLADPAGGGLDPDEVELLRANVLWARGRRDDARRQIVQARDRRPDRLEPWLALAALASAEGSPEDGLGVLDEAARRLGDRVDLRLARVRFIGQSGDPTLKPGLDAAGRDLEKLAEPDRVAVEDALAGAFAQLGDATRAEQLWAEVLRSRPQDLRVAMSLFDLSMRAGPTASQPEASRRAVDRIRQIEGAEGTQWRHAEAIRLLDRARRGSGDRPDAIRALIKEIDARRPNWTSMLLLEAEVAELEGSPERALVAYLRAIERGECRPDVVQRVVGLLVQQGRTAEADRMIRRLVEQAPPSGPMAQLAAEMAMRGGDTSEALDFARRAVRPDSTDVGEHLWLGQTLERLGRDAEAEAELRRSLALDPARPEPRVALVRLLVRAGRRDQAEAAIVEARRSLPPEVAPTALASCLEAVGRPGEALEQRKSALDRNPGDPALRLTYAASLLRTNRPRDAEAAFRSILEPGSGASPRQRAVARRDLAIGLAALGPDRLAEAVALIERNLEEDGKSLDDRRVKALLLQARPAFRREAIRTFEDLARQAPLSSGEKFLLARLQAVGDQWFKARELLAGLLADDPKNPSYLLALAGTLLDHGQVADAAPLVARLDEVAPRAFATVDLKARLLNGQGQGDAAAALLQEHVRAVAADLAPAAAALERLGRFDAAEAIHRRLANAPTANAEAGIGLAFFLARRGRAAEALDACERCRAGVSPARFANVCLQIVSTARAGDDQRGRVEAWLRESLGKQPADPSLLFDLANLEDMGGHYDRAEALLRQVVARTPRSSGPLNNLAWLLAVRGGRADEALDLVNRAIAIDGPDPDLLDTRSLVYLAQDKADRAVADLEEVAATRPSAMTYFHLALAQNEAGNRGASRDLLRKAGAAGLDEQAIHPIERPKFRQLQAALARQ